MSLNLSFCVLACVLCPAILDAQVGNVTTIRVNVVDDAANTPIPNARITLRGDGQTLAEPIAARTDEHGVYQFSVPHGSYLMSVEKATFFPSKVQRFEAKEGAAPLEIRLIPMREISGRVALQDGTPVFYAMVSAISVKVEAPQRARSLPIVTRTNQDGSFTLGEVPPGRYYLSINQSTYYPANDGRLGDLIDLRRSTQASVGTVTVEKRTGVSITGSIEESSLYPAKTNAVVFLLSSSKDSRQVAQAVTTNGGSFTLPNVPPGNYVMFANLIGLQYGPSSFFGLQRIEVGSANLQISLKAPDPVPIIDGVVELDHADQPPSKVGSVDVVPELLTFPMVPVPRALSHPDGTFTTPTVSPASAGDVVYSLRIEGLPENAYVSAVTQGGEPIQEPLTARANNGLIHILLKDDGGAIKGRLEGQPSTTQDHPLVVLAPADEPRPQHAYRVSAVDPQGQFHLTGIGPGVYDLVLLPDEDDYDGPSSIPTARILLRRITVTTSSQMEVAVPRP